MSIQIVNGYACLDCADVAQAKRGIDPAQRQAGDLKAADREALARTPPPSPDPARGRALDLQA